MNTTNLLVETIVVILMLNIHTFKTSKPIHIICISTDRNMHEVERYDMLSEHYQEFKCFWIYCSSFVNNKKIQTKNCEINKHRYDKKFETFTLNNFCSLIVRNRQDK